MSRLPLVALLVCGCASTGAKRFAVQLSQDDIVARTAALQKVDDDIGLLDEEPLAGYLQSVGSGIGYPQVVFTVLDSAEPNAYAIDGGAVFVSRGLLALLNDEGELAAVLGHEVGHIAKNHAKKRELVSAPFDVMGRVLQRVLGLIKPKLGNDAAQATSTTARIVAIAPVSRAQERHADEAGVELAAAAGYDPLALAQVLTRLNGFVTPQSRSWLDDHPKVDDRTSRIGEHAAELHLPAAPARHPTLLPMLDGMVLEHNPMSGVVTGTKIVNARYDVVYEVPREWHSEREGDMMVSGGDGCTVLLQGAVGEGSPDEVMRRNVRAGTLEVVEGPQRVGELPHDAVRGRTDSADIHMELVVFGDERRSHLLTGAWPVENNASCTPRFEKLLTTLRPTTAADLAALPVVRLRVMVAHENESLALVLARAACPWPPEKVAALNGVAVNHVFTKGAAVKVPHREIWRER